MDFLDHDDSLGLLHRPRSVLPTRNLCSHPAPEQSKQGNPQSVRLTNSTSQAKRLRKADPEKNTAIYAEHEKQDWSPVGILKRTLYRPFYMLYKEPILVLITIYLSFIYGILYARKSPSYLVSV